MEFSAYTRNNNIQEISKSIHDLVIIGGGINGAGIAREAAIHGLQTVLFEKGDFASGTSSRSSRMIHGGLRYLKYGQFKLVKESLKERAILLKIAPDLVKPIRFLFPVYDSVIMKYKIRIGLMFYDILAGVNKIKSYKPISPNTIRKNEPLLNQNKLKGGFIYSDASVDDSNLVLASILSAVNDGCSAFNYTEVISFKFKGGNWEIQFKDVLTEKIGTAKSMSLVIATGVWLDKFNFGENKLKNFVRITKGIHIVLPKNKLDIAQPVVVPTIDNRILFAINYKEFIYIGTTDTDYNENPDSVFANSEDVDYLLNQINNLFPNSNIKKKDIISVWAGLRPLVNNIGNPSDVSREELIKIEDNKLILVLGGKLTTFRLTSERVINHLFKLLKSKRSNLKKSQNIELFEMKSDFNNIVEETRYHLKATMALTISDVLERRIPLLHFDKSNGLNVLDDVLAEMSQFLNWDNEEINRQRTHYIEKVNKIKRLLD